MEALVSLINQCAALTVHASQIHSSASDFCWRNSCIWEQALGNGTATLCCYFLSSRSCCVLFVEIGRSDSCSSCSLTGRRCWANPTDCIISAPLHRFLVSALCPPHLSFLFPLTLADLKWHVSEGLPSISTKTQTLAKKNVSTLCFTALVHH